MRNSYLFNLKLFTLLTAIWLTPLTVIAQDNEPPALNQRESSTVLERILSLFRSRQNSLITRSEGDVCFISPGSLGEQEIWSDRPLFIMAGEIPQAQITVHSPTTNYNFERDGQVVWTTDIAPDTKILAYGGEQLQPGFTYDWIFSETEKEYKPISFKLLPQSEREKIAAELTTLETELQQQGATTEDIAIAKADFFVSQQLLADALQQLHSVKQPSLTLDTKMADLKQFLCTDS